MNSSIVPYFNWRDKICIQNHYSIQSGMSDSILEREIEEKLTVNSDI